MSVVNETLMAVSNLESECATVRRMVEELVEETDEFRKTVALLVKERNELERRVKELEAKL